MITTDAVLERSLRVWGTPIAAFATRFDFAWESLRLRIRKAGEHELSLVDRWILDRLANVNADCRSAYEDFQFHKVYHTLNEFCAVDLSSLYIDITKDWLYCDAPDSQRRRATQATMHTIFDTLSRLLAPILVFTAEEAWSHFRSSGSVHLQEFFQGGDLD
jgi:isoleucyl-tRNA synthetase